MTTDVNELSISLFLHGWHTCRVQVFGLCESTLLVVHGIRRQEQLLTGAHSGTGTMLARDFCHVTPNCLEWTGADRMLAVKVCPCQSNWHG